MSTKTSSTSESKPPAWAAPLFTQSASEAQNLYDSGQGGNVYQGQTVAGLGGTTQAGINGVQKAAGAYAGGPPGNALTDMASGKYLKDGNPYFNDALQGQLDSTANQVQSQFSGAGRYGSGANTNALTTSLGNIRSSALSNQFNQDSQNVLGATNALNSWNQGAIGANQATIQAGQLQDQNQQAGLDAALQKFQAQDNSGWTKLGLLQSAAAGSAGNYGVNTQQTSTGFNPMQAIGAVGSAATKKGPAASDIRLKENIVPAGKKNGFNLYEWNYKGAPERFRGVMAQEVIKIAPEAVVVAPNGFYAVHYDFIGLEMEAL